MENVVAVKLVLEDNKECFFMTWGRIQHPTDPNEIEKLILRVSDGFAVEGKPKQAELCYSLQEASKAPFFYEAIIDFSQKAIPSGKEYEPWKGKMNDRMQEGKEIYFLGMN